MDLVALALALSLMYVCWRWRLSAAGRERIRKELAEEKHCHGQLINVRNLQRSDDAKTADHRP